MIANKKYFQKGFSVLELLVAILILSILTSMSLVGYRSFVQNTNSVTLANDFVTTLAYARSAAVKLGIIVSVCPATNANLQACGNSGNWTNGWIVFQDSANTGVISNANQILKVHDPLQAGSVVTTTLARIAFNSLGYTAVGTGTVALSASGCVGNNARTITITSTGRAQAVVTNCP
jgi:type IV fimbrial biogenesis protein FimT